MMAQIDAPMKVPGLVFIRLQSSWPARTMLWKCYPLGAHMPIHWETCGSDRQQRYHFFPSPERFWVMLWRIDCILDLMFPAHLSLGCNYAEFLYFYLKPPVGQCADLATRGRPAKKPVIKVKKLVGNQLLYSKEILLQYHSNPKKYGTSIK
jgi:hypothetical protein